jgi:hypothetical protein
MQKRFKPGDGRGTIQAIVVTMEFLFHFSLATGPAPNSLAAWSAGD